MPEYDISFADKLSQVACQVLADGIEEIEAQRTVLYLSLLSTEIALKAMLEKAGKPIAGIRSRSHNIAGLLSDLDHCNVCVEDSHSLSASRIRAIELSYGVCLCRLNIDPPCRLNIDPGLVANFRIGNCG